MFVLRGNWVRARNVKNQYIRDICMQYAGMNKHANHLFIHY